MIIPSTKDAPVAPRHRHTVQLYEQDSFLIASVAGWARDAFDRGENVLLVMTDSHLEMLMGHFSKCGVPAVTLISQGRLTTRNADKLLASFMVGGWPDKDRFDGKIGRLIQDLLKTGVPLNAFGEMVNILWQTGRRDAALALEEIWNQLQKQHTFRLSCAYRASPLDLSMDVDHFEGICRSHDHAAVAEESDRLGQAFFRAVRQAVPRPHLDMLESWISNGGFENGARVSQGVVWLRRYMPELSTNVLKLARSLFSQKPSAG